MPAPFAYNWTHSVYILHPFAFPWHQIWSSGSGPSDNYQPPNFDKTYLSPHIQGQNLLTPGSPHAHKGSSFTAWQNLSQVDCDDGALSELADDDHQRGHTARRTRSVCPTGSTW